MLVMKLLLITIIAVATLASLPKAQADPYTGYYKIATVITVTDFDQIGATGRFKVYFNSNNKLRLKGYIDTTIIGKIPVRGKVNPSNGKITLTLIEGEAVPVFTNALKIIKRNDTVVGLKGYLEEFGDSIEFVGYKTRDLPE